MPRFSISAVLPPLLLLLAAGCGPREVVPVPVRGTVSLDGKPLPEAEITFASVGFVPVILPVKDGAFEGEVKPGSSVVEIRAYRPYQLPPGIPAGMSKKTRENYLPEKYGDATSLKAEITQEGPNQFNFELKSR